MAMVQRQWHGYNSMMIATLSKPTYLPADLLQMSDAASCELVDGRLVELLPPA
jgi:hypothetical protein